MHSLRLPLSFSISMLASIPACSSTTTPGDTGPSADVGHGDTGMGEDVPGLDTGAADDTGTSSDGGLTDVGTATDAPSADAGMCMDLPADATRPVAITCSACRPPGISGPGGVADECANDADCTDGDNGRCRYGRAGAYCDYDACFSDNDCQEDEACLCDGASSGTGGGNVCVPAECRVNADCAGGFPCSPTLGSCGHYTNFVAYRCHRAEDECSSDADCGPGYCAFDEALGHWACSTTECAG
jgi:hypothetical protein